MTQNNQDTPVRIGLNAVIASAEGETPKALCVAPRDAHVADKLTRSRPTRNTPTRSAPGAATASLPYGAFDPARHRTFESGLREWVERQTNVRLGYVEQLYTFGDKGREAPAALLDGDDQSVRVVSVGYLALTPATDLLTTPIADHGAQWRSWYDFFPWEDWRKHEPVILADVILPGLRAWIDRAPDAASIDARRTRARLAFGYAGVGWEEERALDRYEIMYEAGLVAEAWRDRTAAGLALPRADPHFADQTGAAMASDHRRILSTAIGRLRGKLKYRAIIFDLTPAAFTLLTLQRAVESIVGFSLHKQNFRRSIEGSGLVEKTGDIEEQASGRPAALFRLAPKSAEDRAAKGLSIPRLKRSPGGDL